MSKKLSRSDALEDISNWSISDVLWLLRKNALEDCCNAIAKRQVDGDEFLHLTEGKLALWKSDLTRPLIWNLWSFVEKVKKTPEKYVEEKMHESHMGEDNLSDTGSWGTDFEGETNEEVVLPEAERVMKSKDFEKHRNLLRESKERKRVEMDGDEMLKEEDDGIYANCNSVESDDSVYANFQETKNVGLKNTSRLHGQAEKSLAEQLKEQLKLRNAKKPMVGPKPDSLSRGIEITQPGRTQPQRSFLHDVKTRPSVPSQKQKRMSVPPPPEPRKFKDQPMIIEKCNKDQSKAPATLRNLDLVANLPIRTEESEDEYEAFDEQIIEQNQKRNHISRADSKQSLTSGHQSSIESVYQPPSITSHEDEDEHYEIYESITETPDDNDYYLSPIQRMPNTDAPPPLPAKPLHSSTTPSPTLTRPKAEKENERSPEKKSATLPHSSSNASLSTERATRPLPPPPDRQSYVDKPWFHNVTREQATALIKDQSTYGNPQDGYFLLRPSTTNVINPLALVLWYKDRVFNIPVRKRPDNRFALGSAKVNEESFSSIEEIVIFYRRKELVLNTGGMQMEGTKLTDTPPK